MSLRQARDLFGPIVMCSLVVRRIVCKSFSKQVLLLVIKSPSPYHLLFSYIMLRNLNLRINQLKYLGIYNDYCIICCVNIKLENRQLKGPSIVSPSLFDICVSHCGLVKLWKQKDDHFFTYIHVHWINTFINYWLEELIVR